MYVCECVCMYSHRLAIVTIHTNTPTHSDVRELTFELFFMCIIIIIIVSINIVLLSSSTFCAQISVRYSFQPHMRMDRLIYTSMYSHTYICTPIPMYYLCASVYILQQILFALPTRNRLSPILAGQTRQQARQLMKNMRIKKTQLHTHTHTKAHTHAYTER